MAGTSLAIYDKIDNVLDFIDKMAGAYGVMCGATNKEAGMAVAMQCLHDKISPMEFQAKYHLIMNKPSKKAIAMLDDFENLHGGEYKIIASTPLVCEIYFKNAKGQDYTEKFTRLDMMLSRWPWDKNPGWQKSTAEVRERIKKGESEEDIWGSMAPRFKDNWGTELDWQNMLMNRRISTSLTYVCPAAKAGYYTPEEIEDVIEGELVPDKPAPLTASEFVKRQQEQQASQPSVAAQASTSATPASAVVVNAEAATNMADDGEVVDAEFELTPTETIATEPTATQKRLIDRIMDNGPKAFGDKWQNVLAGTLSKRSVGSLFEIAEAELQKISDQVDAKLPKN